MRLAGFGHGTSVLRDDGILRQQGERRGIAEDSLVTSVTAIIRGY